MANEGEEDRDAAAIVFGVTELLETILLKVDMKTLLFSQRVNKGWKAVISNSSPLQKKLFFRSATVEEAMRFSAESDEEVIMVDMRPQHGSLYPLRFAVANPLLCADHTIRYKTPSFLPVRNPVMCTRGKHAEGYASWWRMHLAHCHFPEVEIEGTNKFIEFIDETEWRVDLSGGGRRLACTLRGIDGETRTVAELFAIMEMKCKRGAYAHGLDASRICVYILGETVSTAEFEKVLAQERESAVD